MTAARAARPTYSVEQTPAGGATTEQVHPHRCAWMVDEWRISTRGLNAALRYRSVTFVCVHGDRVTYDQLIK